jgi:hypothetical protein
MAMTAYFDESGTHGKSSPSVVVASLLGSTTEWANYERHARRLFDEFGISIFHAKKFRAGKGKFAGWDDASRKQFITRLMKLMDDHLDRGIAVCVSQRDFHEIYQSGNLKRTIRKDSIYALCFRACMWIAIDFMQSRKDKWPLTAVLESGHRNAGDAERVYQELRKKMETLFSGMLGPIAFEEKEKCLALSAPDALAHISFRIAAGSHKSEGTMLPHYYNGLRLQRYTLNKESLAGLIEMMRENKIIPDTIKIIGKMPHS